MHDAVGHSTESDLLSWRTDAGADAGMFLLLVGVAALPYVVGFAYTRHVSVLIYPSVLVCCRMLDGRVPE